MARVAINTGATPNDGTGDSLRAAGGIINDNFLEIYTHLGAGSTTDLSAPVWNTTSAGINTLRNVGVGTTNPRFALEVGSIGASGTSLYVNGDARVTGILTVGSSSISLDGNSNTIKVGSGVTINGSTNIVTVGSGVTINGTTGAINVNSIKIGGIDVVTGSAGTWAINSSGIHTTKNVGIGTTNPTSALTVGGGTSTRELYVTGVSTFRNPIDIFSTLSIKTSTDANIFSISYDSINDDISFNWQQSGGTGGSQVIWYIPETSSFVMRNPAVDEKLAQFTTGGSVELYYDGSNKFETLGAGVTVTGTTFTNQLNVSGVSTFDGSVSSGSSITATEFYGIARQVSTIEVAYFGNSVQIEGNQPGTYLALNSGSDPVAINDNNYSNGIDGQVLTATGDDGSGNANGVVWGSSLYVKSGGVGIGTTNPTSKLTVSGDVLVSGVVTASSFSGSASGLTNIPSGQLTGALPAIDGSALTGIVASGTGVVIKDDGSAVGTAATIDFGSNLSVSFGSGIATITATGGGGTSYWESTAAGIHTLSSVGIGTTNPTSALTVKGNTSLETLNVSGVSTFSGAIDANSTANFQGDVTLQSNLILGDNDEIQLGAASGGDLLITHLSSTNNSLIRNKNTSGSFIIDTATGSPIEIRHSSGGEPMGIFTPNGSVSLYYDNSNKFETLGTGVTVTGTTFTNQLNVSGVSTLGTLEISSGIVTASSGIVTYYGDTSNATDAKWTLGANGTSDYTFTGIGFTQTTNDPVLYLTRGEVYEFVNNSGGSHPFQIRESNGGSAYSNGVTNNGAASGTIRFEVPFNAPNTLYYQCTNHSGMGATIFVTPRIEPSVGSRTTVTGNTGSIGSGSTANLNINGFKTYSLLKVGISSAAWVVLYTDADSRTADASRSYLTDPTPGSGVIAEVRTTSAGISTFLMSPGVIGWNNDVSVGSTIYAKVTNNESSTSSGIDVTLTVVKLED